MRRTPWPRRRSTRNPWGAVATLIAIALIAGLAALVWPPPGSISGRAVAVDGDTLKIDATRIRLIGLDAVELDQTCADGNGVDWPCGQKARALLDKLTDHGTAKCIADGRDRYRRVLAHCSVDGADLGEEMVRGGWAVAELEYGLALAEARLNGRGIWSGTFDDPADWRRRQGTERFDFWTWLMGVLGR